MSIALVVLGRVLHIHYLSINSVRTNGPTLCPNVWLPYAPEYLDQCQGSSHRDPLRGQRLGFVNKATYVSLSERFFSIFGSVWEPYIRA